jgi:integrase
MARLEKKLSAVALKKLGSGLHGDGLNLWFQVTPRGNRSWLLRYYRNGRAKAMGLGPLHTVSLAEAREKALAARKLILAGLDPMDERDKVAAEARLNAARAITFRTAAERYIDAHRAGWKNAKHADQWMATLATYAYPVVGDLPVARIDVGHVMKVIEPIWAKKTETASRVRGRMESVLDWATARGYRSGDNPARWRGHLDKLLPARSKVQRVEHFAAMSYAQVPAFMRLLAKTPGVSALGLRFTILTAARTGDTIGATWDEIDLKAALWVIPGVRMKAQREHRVPLSTPALEILRATPRVRGTPYVFPGGRLGRPLSSMAMLETLRERRPGLTVHGFRSAFRDWAAECTPHPAEVAEMALAHIIKDKTEAAYRRGELLEKRRALMEDWAKFCDA